MGCTCTGRVLVVCGVKVHNPVGLCHTGLGYCRMTILLTNYSVLISERKYCLLDMPLLLVQLNRSSSPTSTVVLFPGVGFEASIFTNPSPFL